MLVAYRKKLDRVLSEYLHAKQTVSDEREKLDEVRDRLQAVTEAQALVQTAAESVQNIAHQQIASVVTRCLQTVFGDEYEFKINFVKRRNRTEAELILVKDGHEVDPMMSSGGGILDTMAFALRISCLILMQPRRRRVMILDEPFKWVSQDHIPTMRSLLMSLAKELEIQFVIVTHLRGLVCGKVVEIGG